MSPSPLLTYKVASEPWEFEKIHELNYRTFVEEIPQHEPNAHRRLVDPFNGENIYVICLEGRTLLGMAAVRGNRPFSLDAKLENLDAYLPPHQSPCELRLLSVEKDRRHTFIFQGLLRVLAQVCLREGFDLALISGTVRQLKLYGHLGFIPFGPLVGKQDALFQPMYLTRDQFEQTTKRFAGETLTPAVTPAATSFLPGPVAIHQDIVQAFQQTPIPHRSRSFVSDFQYLGRALCRLVNAQRVQILLGSGTLANDAVAWQLAREGRPGLVVSNGEFGDRLIDHAKRAGLVFEVLQTPWGDPFERGMVLRSLDRHPQTGWLWATHCETSTGVLNDLDGLKALARERNLGLCMDCISSIATVPLDLDGVYLATAVSGKGFGAFPGLSMVFHDHPIHPAPERLPRYLDLGYYAEQQGIPFTTSSNLIYALMAANERFGKDPESRFAEIRRTGEWLRAELRRMGLHVVAPEEHASPAVVTLALDKEINSVAVGRNLERAGFLLSYRSTYLSSRNWIQVCLMGCCPREKVEALVRVLPDVIQHEALIRRVDPLDGADEAVRRRRPRFQQSVWQDGSSTSSQR